MKRTTKILAGVAILLLPTTLFAHEKGGDHKEHCKLASATVDKAIALIDQAAKTSDPAQKDKALGQARQQLMEVKEHMSHCTMMGDMDMKGMDHGKMGNTDHGSMGDMKGMDHGNMGEMKGMDHGNMGNMDAKATAQVTDPVCGMKVADPKTAPRSIYAGKSYYFCSKEDKAKFDKDPGTYLKKGL